MKAFKKIVTLIFISALFMGCSEDEILYPPDLVKWVESHENGMISQKEINEYQFTVLYKPLDYLILKENKLEEISEKVLREKKSEVEELQYFTLRIGLNDGTGDVLKENMTDPKEYYAKVEYFSFAMQKDIVLVDGNDTLKCVLYHFERAYGLAPYCDFSLAFENGEKLKSGNKTLIIDDRILGIGRVKMTIKEEDINRIPELKTT